ncbi:hypothetical protein Patl1_25345 [Pistacia atlantica]|uniref:Uncharacterized protein n=1 Tax=Pistacia atlantica TaxID=434234 RepID=A0ACC1B3D5_9ROSI|nr:hypothetical protein Patl1_25345 [Pistacia atlantica]
MEPSRISLRPFKLSDVDDFLKWASDDRVTRYLRWNTITSREEALNYLDKVAIPHPWRRSICLDGPFDWLYFNSNKKQALVEVENKGSQRVLEKVGFLKEGLLRKYGFCKGEIRDMFVYGFIYTDKVM